MQIAQEEEWVRELIVPAVPPAVRDEILGYNLAPVRWEQPPDLLWLAYEAPPSSGYREFGRTRMFPVDFRRRMILEVLSLPEFDRKYPKTIGPRLEDRLKDSFMKGMNSIEPR